MFKRKGILGMSLCIALILSSACGCAATGQNAASEQGAGSTDGIAGAEEIPDAGPADAGEEDPFMKNELVIRGRSYTGLTNLKNENSEDGTYFYEDMTGDGMTVITNMSAPNAMKEEQDDEAYVSYFVSTFVEQGAKVVKTVQDQAGMIAPSYLVYRVEWENGANEDSRKAVGVVVPTDLYTYYYGFACPLDFYEENEEFYLGELADVRLVEINDPSAGASGDAGTAADTEALSDLAIYFGADIEQALAGIPGLEDSIGDGTEYGLRDEVTAEGVLAGPFIYVDAQKKINGISYGGTKFSLAGISTGMPMEDAGKIAKDAGWKFVSVTFAHGTAHQVVTYENGDRELVVVSDADGDFGRSEESDIMGNVESVYLSVKK